MRLFRCSVPSCAVQRYSRRFESNSIGFHASKTWAVFSRYGLFRTSALPLPCALICILPLFPFGLICWIDIESQEYYYYGILIVLLWFGAVSSKIAVPTKQYGRSSFSSSLWFSLRHWLRQSNQSISLAGVRLFWHTGLRNCKHGKFKFLELFGATVLFLTCEKKKECSEGPSITSPGIIFVQN